MIDKAQDFAFNIGKLANVGQAYNHISSAVENSLKDINERIKAFNNGDASKWFIGDELIDRELLGLEPGFIIVAARAGMAKTSYALNIMKCAANTGKKVLFSTLEMTEEALIKRMLSSITGINKRKLRSGDLDKHELKLIEDAGKYLSGLNVKFDSTSTPNISELAAKIKDENLNGKVDMVIVDYIQLMEASTNKNFNKEQEISEISRGLKLLSKDLNIPVIGLSQLSRAVESRTDKRPIASDLRASGSLEQDADIIMMLYRDEYYLTQEQKEAEENAHLLNRLEVNIVKGREDGAMQLVYKFVPQYMSFTEWQGTTIMDNNKYEDII